MPEKRWCPNRLDGEHGWPARDTMRRIYYRPPQGNLEPQGWLCPPGLGGCGHAELDDGTTLEAIDPDANPTPE